MKVYISGRITYDKKNYKKRFAIAAYMFRCERIEVFNPAEHEIDTTGMSKDEAWKEYLKRDIPELLKCDSIYLLPWWWLSRGARLEWYIAKKLGIRRIIL